MGSELNLWWHEAGTVRAATERVATAIPLRLAFLDGGPAAFRAFVAARPSGSYTSAYGSFLADATRRVLVLYVAEDEVGGARGIAALMDRVGAAWAGWRVLWAVGGEPQVRRVLALVEASSGGGAPLPSPALDAWLAAPGAPDRIRALLGERPADDSAPTPGEARADVQATLDACWREATEMSEGVDDDGEVRAYFFGSAASGGGTDVVLMEAGAVRTARVPASTAALLVDPAHPGEVVRTGHGPLLRPVEPGEPHGPPEAIWLDVDRRRLDALPTLEELWPLLEVVSGPAWRVWDVHLGATPAGSAG